MKCIGILTVQKEKTRKKTRKKIREAERFLAETPVVVGEFVPTEEELERKSLRYKQKLYQKGVAFLKKQGADIVVPTLDCGRVFGIPAEKRETAETELSETELPDALAWALKGYRVSPRGRTGWVIDKECKDVCLPLLAEMCTKVQYLGVVTGARTRAESMEDYLCMEYGASLEISSVYPGCGQEKTILVDREKRKIFLDGSVVVNGKRVKMNLREYPVDQVRLFRLCPELFEAAAFCGWCRRKSG